MSKLHKAIIALIIANIIWGATPPIVKWSLTNIPLFSLAFLRFAIPTIILGIIFRKHLSIKPKSLLLTIVAATFSISLNILFFFLAMQKTESINAPIIGSSGPIFIMLGAFFFLNEHPSKRVILGNLLGFFGILVIVFQPLVIQHETASFMGNLLLILATLGSVIGTILTKKIMKKNHPQAVIFWSFAAASIFFLPFFFSDLTLVGFLPHLALPGLVGLIFCILFASSLAYYCYFWALKYTTASETGLFMYIDPIVTVLIAIPLLAEYPSPTFLFGAALVFAGIFIAEGRLHYHPLHKIFGKH